MTKHNLHNQSAPADANHAHSDQNGSWLDYIKHCMRPVGIGISEQLIKENLNLIGKLLPELQKQKNIKAEVQVIGGFLHNTHISTSEIMDMLIVLDEKQLKNSNGEGTNLVEIQELRNFTKNITKELFPGAKIDDSQPLALEMSIPSRFGKIRLFYGLKQSSQTSASGFYSSQISLFDSFNKEFIISHPLSIGEQIDKKDMDTNFNAKLLIRILKHLKTDLSSTHLLSGFDITSLVYSMEDYALGKPTGQILFLLLECNLFFKKIIENPFLKRSIISPDGRQLIDQHNEPRIMESLNRIITDLELLIKNLVLEVDLYTNIPQETSA